MVSLNDKLDPVAHPEAQSSSNPLRDRNLSLRAHDAGIFHFPTLHPYSKDNNPYFLSQIPVVNSKDQSHPAEFQQPQ